MPAKERAPQRKRLTGKEKALVKAVVLDPDATLDELGESSGYSSRQHVHRALKAPAVVDALSRVRQLMEQREKLKLGSLLTKLEEGLEAVDVRSVKLEGSIVKVAVETPDQATRHKFLNTALELQDAFPKKEAAANGPVTNISIILAGGGSEAEKRALSDALMASRIARGLHPDENRLLTAIEAEALRRTP